MTLLELISNCINFTTQDEEDINPATLEQFRGSTNYRAFIKNALPEINRAIQELVALNKLPMQCIEIKTTTNVVELTEEQNNSIYSIFKVEVETNDQLYSPVEYRRINNKIKLPKISGAETTYIKYYPRIRLLTEADYRQSYENEDDGADNSLDLNTLGINDTICNAVIPYLVKSRIWQEIEPEMAQLDRNIGLQNASMLVNGVEEPYQTSVARTNTYDWGE